jgi:hypothetical protein
MFNPKFKDFLEENNNITLLGLFWAMYWRFFVIVFGVGIVFSILSKIF